MNPLPELTGSLFLVIRAVVALAVFFVSWFLLSPVFRGLYRAAIRKPIPGALLFPSRLGGAAGLAALAFYFLPIGGGGGGLGWGAGPGGGPGGVGGPGDGMGKGTGEVKVQVKNGKKSILREKLEIEIIGGKRYQGDGKFYLLKRQDPPQSLDDLDPNLKSKAERLEVHIILTNESAGGQGAMSPLGKLVDLLNKYGIPSVDKQETAK